MGNKAKTKGTKAAALACAARRRIAATAWLATAGIPADLMAAIAAAATKQAEAAELYAGTK